MKYFNCPMSSSLFSSFQENTKCESRYFADTCTLSVPIFFIHPVEWNLEKHRRPRLDLPAPACAFLITREGRKH